MKRILTTILLAPPTLGLIGFAWSFGVDIKETMARSVSNKDKISILDQRLYEMHWFMIQKNNIKVPPQPTGVNHDRRNKQFRSGN